MAEDTARLSDRRQVVNTLFVSINALFLSGIGYLFLQIVQRQTRLLVAAVAFLFVAIGASLLNRAWLRLSEQSRRLVDLRIRYLKALEALMREGGAFASVQVPLKADERATPDQATLTTRGAYTLEDVLYRPQAKHANFGFSRAEQMVGRTFTTAYWVAVILMLVFGGLAPLLAHIVIPTPFGPIYL